jgi:hypothetical protein
MQVTNIEVKAGKMKNMCPVSNTTELTSGILGHEVNCFSTFQRNIHALHSGRC